MSRLLKTLLICALVAPLLRFGPPPSAQAAPHEILYDVRQGSGFFGGDDRAGQERSVGVGQAVLVDTQMLVESFAFDFLLAFDFVENPAGSGHAVDLTLDVRDDAGNVLTTAVANVAASFTSGWVTWTNLDLNVSAGTLLIFTCYLNGAYDTNEVTSNQVCDSAAGYTDGDRYVKFGTDDADMDDWSGWNVHAWDSNFWLQGSTAVGTVTRSWGSLKADHVR